MKILFILFMAFSLPAQAMATAEKTLQLLWQSLSHDPHSGPDISLLEQIFHPQGVVYAVTHDNDKPELKKWSVAEFIRQLDKIHEKGFYECEISREIKIFNDIAHAMSLVSTRFDKYQQEPEFIGVNSIQLYYDQKRWLIVSLYYQVPDKVPARALAEDQQKCLH